MHTFTVHAFMKLGIFRRWHQAGHVRWDRRRGHGLHHGQDVRRSRVRVKCHQNHQEVNIACV